MPDLLTIEIRGLDKLLDAKVVKYDKMERKKGRIY